MMVLPGTGRRVIAIFALCLASVLPIEQALGIQALTTIAITPDTLVHLRNAVQRELDERVDVHKGTAKQLPGVNTAIVLPDGQLLAFAAGKASLDPPVDMQITTRMPAGSVGKMFVAALTMSLVTDNVLQLDEPIERWLGDEPWFAQLPNHETLTLRHLLNHSGGLIDHVFDKGSEFGGWFQDAMTQADSLASASDSELDIADQEFDPVSLVQFVLDRQPLFTAGQGYHYTDTGYILIGLIIEKATGSTYYELLSERFLEPLKLTLTSPQNRRRLVDLAQGYAIESQAQLGLPATVLKDGRLVFNPLIEWTGGGIVSNPQDLARWITALFNSRILSSKAVEQMLVSVADQGAGYDTAGRAFGYGLGVSIVNTAVGTAYRHGGFFPGYLSMVAFYPDLQLAIAMQINSDGADLEEHFDAVRDIVLEYLDSRPSTR